MAGITFEKLRIVTKVRAETADIRVLLIRLSALGDVVHTIPAAALLRKKLPNAKLSWVVEAPFVELLENNPAVDEVILFPKKLIAKELKNPLCWSSPESELRKFTDDLKRRKFSAAIDFQGLFKSGVIAFLSGAPVRVGFSGARELSPWMMTHKLRGADYFSNETHVVDHNLDLAEFYLRIGDDSKLNLSDDQTEVNFVLPDPDATVFSRVASLLHSDADSNPGITARDDVSPKLETTIANSGSLGQSKISGGTGSVRTGAAGSVKLRASRVISQPPVAPHTLESIRQIKDASKTQIVLIPGTTWVTKIWPKEKWSALVSQLVRLPDVRIVLVGGPSEVEMNSYIYDAVSSSNSNPNSPANTVESHTGTSILNLTGKTSLKDLTALFMVSDIVVGADTGPLHMAAATGIPHVVGVFGSTPWKRNGPAGLHTSVVALDLACQPCFEKKCPLGTIACLNDLQVDNVYNEITRNLAHSHLAD